MSPMIYRILVLALQVLKLYGANCPSGDIKDGDICYKFVDDGADWENAELACQYSYQGHLVTVDSDHVHEFLKYYIKQKGWSSSWIGAKEELMDWKWVDGSYLQPQGCYDDYQVNRTMFEVSRDNDVTPTSCVETCYQNGYYYAGVKMLANSRVVCQCGYRHDKRFKVKGCNEVCPSDSKQKCGARTDGDIDERKILIFRTDGTPVNGWYKDQPNNWDGYQSCLSLSPGNKYKWGDEKCHKTDEHEYGYLCEYRMDQAECRSNGHTYGGGACYSDHHTDKNWYEARYDCVMNRKADLLKFTSQESLQEIISDPTISDSGKRWWVGARNRKFVFRGDKEAIYTKFATYEPSSKGDTCLMMAQNTLGGEYLWDDRVCNDISKYICERSLIETTPTTTQRTTTPVETTTSTTTTTTTTTSPRTESTTTATGSRTSPSRTSPSRASPSRTQPSTRPTPVTRPSGQSSTTTTTTDATTPSVISTTNPYTDTTTYNSTGSEDKQSSDQTIVLSNGIIIAIVVAAVAVLAATIRLIIYGCMRSRSNNRRYKHELSMNSGKTLKANQNFDNPGYMYDVVQESRLFPDSEPMYATVDRKKSKVT